MEKAGIDAAQTSEQTRIVAIAFPVALGDEVNVTRIADDDFIPELLQ